MKKKVLIIIDMQNDFIDGSLANPAAQVIVPGICELIETGDYNEIILTRDTHAEDYLTTAEGKKLPIEHCIYGTQGWEVNSEIVKAVNAKQVANSYINKPTFGYLHWNKLSNLDEADVDFVGTCTDICVVSNALIVKATFPNANVRVLGNLCAGLTPEKHEAALNTMSSCQIKVIK